MFVMSLPLKRMCPVDERTSPAIVFPSVLLPAPFEPSRAMA